MLYLNIILTVFIIFAAVSYLFLKTKQIRTALPIRKKWYQYRAGQSLSLFILLFGLNQLIIHQSPLSFTISFILIVLGLWAIINFSKRAKHYGRFVKEEMLLNN